MNAKALAGCLPRLIDRMDVLAVRAATAGIGFEIAEFGALRTKEQVALLIRWRDEEVAKGHPYYRVSPWEKGKHPVGGAADVRVTQYPAAMTRKEAYAKLGALAKEVGLVWGGTFPPPADIYHFELPEPRSVLEGEFVDLHHGHTSAGAAA